jgi:hypothetical protein
VPQNNKYLELYDRLAGFLRAAIGDSVDDPEDWVEVDIIRR